MLLQENDPLLPEGLAGKFVFFFKRGPEIEKETGGKEGPNFILVINLKLKRLRIGPKRSSPQILDFWRASKKDPVRA